MSLRNSVAQLEFESAEAVADPNQSSGTRHYPHDRFRATTMTRKIPEEISKRRLDVHTFTREIKAISIVPTLLKSWWFQSSVRRVRGGNIDQVVRIVHSRAT
jgi:hypothetical protein